MDLGRTVLTVDGRDVPIGEVLASAWISGRLEARRRRVAAGLAAQHLAAEAGEELDETEFQDALDAWRVDRDLIAAEELEAWLERRGLVLDDVLGCLERDLWTRRHAASEAPEPDAHEVASLVPAEAEVHGDLRALREAHALRAVAPEGVGEPEERALVEAGLLHAAGLESVGSAADFLGMVGVSETRARELLEREVDFELHRRALVAPDAVQDALGRMASDLVRFELVSAELRNEDTAREVLCCVRADRDPFLRGAARAGVPARRETLFATEVEGLPYGHRLASARPNDLFGPHRTDSGHLVAQLLSRLEPDLSVESVARRLEQRLVARAMSRAVSERVAFPVEEAS